MYIVGKYIQCNLSVRALVTGTKARLWWAASAKIFYFNVYQCGSIFDTRVTVQISWILKPCMRINMHTQWTR